MIIEAICVMFLSYIFYRQGIRQLFKSRIFQSNRADHVAYALFMISGLFLGSLFCLSILFLWFPETPLAFIVLFSSVTSIISGEWMYRKNKRIIEKTVKTDQKEK
jgi:hypothetical protein